MCGFVGFVDYSKKADINILKNMARSIHHRGPDSDGYIVYETDAEIGLAHKRLSILDLSNLGNQPMTFDHLTIVYNGEVYNYREIRKELETFGYVFHSNTDTEVILKAFHKWGLNSIEKFIGMFAIVIYDRKQEKIFLIRDRLGVKPLYYCISKDFFLFSSEIKSFHNFPFFNREIDQTALALYLYYGYIPQPFSIFKNTWKLEPGHYGIFDIRKKEFYKKKYWDIESFYKKQKLQLSYNEILELTENLIISSVLYRKISDVPIGVFLSGGYDSSLVTAILQKNSSEKIKTFTIGFYEDKYNESIYAKKISEFLGTEHTEYFCSYKDALDIIPMLPDIFDEPFGDQSAIPTYLVSKLARQSVKVTLSADGGDELFGGYTKYFKTIKIKKYMKNSLIKEKIRKLLELPLIENFFQNSLYTSYQVLISILSSRDIIELEESFSNFFLKKELLNLLTLQFDLKVFNNYKVNIGNEIESMLLTDFKYYLPDDILVKTDRTTMSVSLEGREPLLDHRLSELSAQIPIKYKIKNGEGKLLLKDITHKYIPKELIDRPKMGFSIPVNNWLHTYLKDLVEYMFNEISKNEFFNKKEIEKIYFLWKKGIKGKLARKVWLLLVFQLWYDRWVK